MSMNLPRLRRANRRLPFPVLALTYGNHLAEIAANH